MNGWIHFSVDPNGYNDTNKYCLVEKKMFNKTTISIFYFILFFNVCLPQEVHRLQKEADEANKRSSVMERDNQRCELQLVDMAQQVGFDLFSST